MKLDDQHEIAVRESPCSEPLPISVIITIFLIYNNFINIIGFLTVIFNYLLTNLLKMRKKADDYFLKL